MKQHQVLLLIAFIGGILLLVVPQINPTIIQTLGHKEYYYASEALGTSMYPTIKNGDTLIILEKSSPDFTINVGDILVYERNGTAIAHRVVGVYCCGFFVKGDNCNQIENVSYTQIIGKVIGINH